MVIFVVSALLISLWGTSSGYITYIEIKMPLKGDRSPPGSPWPLPKTWKKSDNLLRLDLENFYISSEPFDCDIIDNALERYRTIIASNAKGKKCLNTLVPELEGLYVQVLDHYNCGYPKLGEDESYSLQVSTEGFATLRSLSVWGALRGLETFSQLVYQDNDGNFLINSTEINDAPRFEYRGVMLDTARHFLPMEILKKNLDAMAYNKFNAFHWHIIDDQSFPFESKVFPNLTMFGAYSPKHIYTQDDVREIIQYARLRGIRVIPEFDSPGHTQAFGQAFPWLLTPCYGEGPGCPYTASPPEHGAAEILNPMREDTYAIFKTLLEEVKTVFQDEFIHLGMDEVYYACWKSSPEITEFMKENRYTRYNEVEQHYVRRTLQNVQDIGYKYMIWQDPIDNGVQAEPGTIVQIWKDKPEGTKRNRWDNYITPIARKGYKIVLSSCWYLNYISYGPDWRKFYECFPEKFYVTNEEKKSVIGGEACMWGEYVDGTNVLPRLWPRASAVAERLWSPSELTRDTDSAAFRLDEHRCRMVRRGIPAEPILNGFCGDYELDYEEREIDEVPERRS